MQFKNGRANLAGNKPIGKLRSVRKSKTAQTKLGGLWVDASELQGIWVIWHTLYVYRKDDSFFWVDCDVKDNTPKELAAQ